MAKTKPYIYILLFFASGAMMAAATFFAGLGREELLRNTVVALAGAGVLDYLLADARLHNTLSYDNADHPGRFVPVYLLCLAAAMVMPQMSFLVWPYAAVFVVLSFFSCAQVGFYAGAYLLAMSVMLSGDADPGVFFMYLMSGAVAVAMFSHLDEELRVSAPIGVTLLLQSVFVFAYHFLFLHSKLRLDTIAIPLINLAVTGILLFVSTHIFAMSIIRKDTDRYMDINDPEFSLLSALKQKDREEYFRAIHTAYLAERIAADLSLDVKRIKSCAYYHRIGSLDGDPSSWEGIEHYFDEFEFPEEACALIREYLRIPFDGVRSKEATVVMFCELIVAKLMEIFQKDKDTHVEYDELIDRAFDSRLSSGMLNRSDLSIYEFDRMKALLKREKLYYDFLR